jgi:hypothetical protein
MEKKDANMVLHDFFTKYWKGNDNTIAEIISITLEIKSEILDTIDVTYYDININKMLNILQKLQNKNVRLLIEYKDGKSYELSNFSASSSFIVQWKQNPELLLPDALKDYNQISQDPNIRIDRIYLIQYDKK